MTHFNVNDFFGFEDWRRHEEFFNLVEYVLHTKTGRRRFGPSTSTRKYYPNHTEISCLGVPVDELHGPHVPGLERLEELGVM